MSVPINNCGNTVNTVGANNPAFGNTCANQSGKENGVETGPTSGPAASDVPLGFPGS